MEQVFESPGARAPHFLTGEPRSSAIPLRSAPYIAAATLTVIVLFLLRLPVPEAAAVLGVVVGLPVLIWAIARVRSDPTWVPFTLLVAAFLNGFPLLNQAGRIALHYGVTLLVCVPLLPQLWRSGVLGKGGYRLFCFYFLWALLTVAYSLEPLFSASRLIASFFAFCAVVRCVSGIREQEQTVHLFDRLLLACGLLVGANFLAAAILPSDITHAMTGSADAMSGQSAAQAQLDNPFPRFSGLLGHPNEVGALMLVVIGVGAMSWSCAGPTKRLLIALIVAGALMLGVMADSRTPFIAVAIGLVAFTLWRYRLRALPLIVALVLCSVALLPHITGKGENEYLTRGDITTLTGRTEVWQFVIEKIKQRPALGYGYEVAGAIFRDPHFQVWWGDWDSGPQSSLHNGYLDHAIGVGVPATLFWLFVIVRSWVAVLRHKQDALGLKPIAWLAVLPMLVHNFSEASVGDFGYGGIGLVFGIFWALAEWQRLAFTENRQLTEWVADNSSKWF